MPDRVLTLRTWPHGDLACRSCRLSCLVNGPFALLPSTQRRLCTKPGALLKDGRYKILRNLGTGRFSSAFLVEDTHPPIDDCFTKYLSANIIFVDSPVAFSQVMRQLRLFKDVRKRAEASYPPQLPLLIDHFPQRGAHGVHYCFLTQPLGSNADAYRATSPTGRLPVHNVKPIIASVAEALEFLHGLDIIHGDIDATNVVLDSIGDEYIEKILLTEPLGFQCDVTWPWDAPPLESELMTVTVSNLGYAMWVNDSQPSGDIGSFALRAPENLIRAKCEKPIDIWAVGCMTYELLTGKVLFQPPAASMDITPDESMLLMQYALTGETLDKTLVEQSRVKDQYFDGDGNLIKAKTNPYPSQTIKSLLEQNTHSELTARQIDAASQFIKDCLRLNPGDRKTALQVLFHEWLENALMGGSDESGAVQLFDRPPPSYDTISWS